MVRLIGTATNQERYIGSFTSPYILNKRVATNTTKFTANVEKKKRVTCKPCEV